MNLTKAKRRFQCQKYNAQKRNISFSLTFQQWYDWWLKQGIDKNQSQLPKNKNTLCMCRYGDKGGYDLNNIYCADVSTNVKHQRKNIPFIIKQTKNRKKIQTPLGIFNSRIEATKAFGVDPTTIGRWLKSKSNQFFYV